MPHLCTKDAVVLLAHILTANHMKIGLITFKGGDAQRHTKRILKYSKEGEANDSI